MIEGGGVFEVTESVPIAFAGTTIASNVARGAAAVMGGVAQGGGFWGVPAKTGSLTMTGMTIASNRLEVSGVAVASGGNLFAENTGIGDTIVANGVGPRAARTAAAGRRSSPSASTSTPRPVRLPRRGRPGEKDPLLGPLQDNGGPTPTMAPAAASPAIDHGAAFGLMTDQRGVERPIDLPSIPNATAVGADSSDIGAFELQPSNALRLGKLKKNKGKAPRP